MTRMARFILAILLLGGASLAGYFLASDMLGATAPEAGLAPGAEGGPLVVETEPAQVLTFAETVEAVGTTRARQSVALHPAAAGRVAEIGFAAGDRVVAGDVLLRLDDAAARAGLAAAEATLAEMRAGFDRQRRLAESGTAADVALEAARAALQRAEAERDMAANTLGDRVIRAPFAGVLGLSDLALGQWVDNATQVTTLDDLSVVEVAFSVPEQHLARLSPGQTVRLMSPAYPGEPFLGRISAIDTRVDQATRSIALRAEVPNGDGRLAGGMFMRASLVLAEHETTAVPERALTVSGDQAFIYVARGGTAHRVDVVTGAQRGAMIGVESDLPEGVAVIVSNLHSLRDGTEVEATTARRASAAGPGE